MGVKSLAAILGGVVLAAACGSNDNGGSNPDSGTPFNGPSITISNYTYSPLELTVDAGTTIAIINQDSMAHTVTSETADNAFTPGAVAGVSFDTGLVQPTTGGAPGTGGPYGYGRNAATTPVTITIPASAPSGTVIPYFCTVHTNTMATPNGHITVR